MNSDGESVETRSFLLFGRVDRVREMHSVDRGSQAIFKGLFSGRESVVAPKIGAELECLRPYGSAL